MSAITRYLAMLRLFGMLLCAAAMPSVATATVPVTAAVAASDVEEEAVEASAVGVEAEAARDAGYESAEVPALARRVTDLTATLGSAERARLEASLAALEARKGAQVAILMVPSTYPDSIEAYATRVFEAWKLGRKGIDDGVLVLVAKDDRRMRIEVGYGLEGTITDIDAGRIIREYMTPAFRQQDYAGGLEAAAQRLVRLIDGEALPPPPRDPLEPGAVRQTLAIAFLLGALGGVALLVRLRAWYWTLGAVVALAAALALGRHWPAGAMVALAEMVAVLGVGFGALLKYSRGARWFFAILVLYALGLFWAYGRYGLPVLHYGLAVPLSLGLTLLMLAGAWQGLRRGRRWAYLPGLLGLLLTLALECLLLLVDDPLNSIEALIILPAACLPLLIGCNFSAGGSGGGRRRGGDYASSSGSSSSSSSNSSSSSSDSFSGGGGSSGGGGASGSW
ncbi:TPM domain-containing protein [Pseudomonas aeruginosa]|uniref:TPM domain-containing protein n=1 Tax=Pseudomonas aeruginosa TaxID=287 RepID=UPI000EACCA03|nr:YgcG family protein [Pseudomonas aeruginosa]